MATKVVISIVDDDESVREAVMSLMRSLGFESEAFHSAEDFLRSDRRRSTSCLIADVQMPGMSGLDLLRHLAASDSPIPTVLITAHTNESVRASALRAGVVGFLSKPFKDGDLVDYVNSALERGATDEEGP